ncbi:MAG: iron dicitrate transport regulator FecR [Spirosoma sp.]|nr:iron dicitrate transport regulator FecR [Spirosoma sp.]
MQPPKELLFSYFAGQATTVQQKVISEWLAQPGSREVYFQWLDEWERSFPQYAPDVTSRFDEFKQRLDSGTDLRPQYRHSMPYEPRPLWRASQWLVAATITAILLGCAWVFSEPLLYQTIVTGPRQLRSIHLPDGSTIALNSHSTLRMPRIGYGWFSRWVRLKGDAVFDVKHLATHQPFVVETGTGLTVDVLGTEFSVRSRSTRAEVVLRRGRVNLRYKALNQPTQQIKMKPGDRVTLDERGTLALNSRADTTRFAHWRYRLFSFNNTPLREVASQMRAVFGIKVLLSHPELERRRLTGTIRAGSSDELAEALAELLDLRVSHHDENIIFSSTTQTPIAQ